MVFPIYNNFTGIKSNFLVVQAEVTGESLGACDERFTRNDTQISKEWSVKCLLRCHLAVVSLSLLNKDCEKMSSKKILFLHK